MHGGLGGHEGNALDGYGWAGVGFPTIGDLRIDALDFSSVVIMLALQIRRDVAFVSEARIHKVLNRGHHGSDERYVGAPVGIDGDVGISSERVL